MRTKVFINGREFSTYLSFTEEQFSDLGMLASVLHQADPNEDLSITILDDYKTKSYQPYNSKNHKDKSWK